VVLPDIDTEEEAGDDSEAEEVNDGDFLADFPDDTEARYSSDPFYCYCLLKYSFYCAFYRN